MRTSLYAVLCFVVLTTSAIGYGEDKAPSSKAESDGKLLRRASDGDLDAQYELGFKKLWSNVAGLVDSRSDEQRRAAYMESEPWLRRAAEGGHTEAQKTLGWVYSKGIGTKQDEKQAFKWFEMAAKSGNTEAMRLAAEALDSGKTGLSKDQASAAAQDWRRKAADREYGEYHFWQGIANSEGLLTTPDNQILPIDRTKAAEHFRLAAERGHAKAQLLLGTSYLDGQGVKEDKHEAFKWLLRAAEQGVPRAQSFVARCYFGGIGTTKDEKSAARWAECAARQSDSDGSLIMGILQLNGFGCPRSEKDAVKWLRMAAMTGEAEAMVVLGAVYQLGKGVPKDEAMGFDWLKRAATAGHPNGQYCLAEAYANGTGIPRDRMTAYAWANLSAAQGNTKAVSLRDDLEHLLTPSELSQAQELSRKWQASNPASARRELEEITRFAEDAIAAKRDSTHSPATTTQRAVAP